MDVSQQPNDLNKLIVWTDNGQANQRFTFKNAGNGRWAMFSAKNGLAVEIPSGNNGTRVHCSQPNKQDNELWQIIPVNKQNFQGHNAVSFKAFSGHQLDVNGGKAEQGAQVIIWDAHGNDNQIWIVQECQFQPNENKLYKIMSGLGHNLVLDVSQQPNDLNKLIVWTDNGQANQRFTFKNAGNGRWAMFSAKNGLAVEIPSGNNGTRVHCSQPNKQDNELWQIIPVNKQNFQGHNAVSFKAFSGHQLDVNGGKAEQGAQVIIWDAHGNDNQIWILQETQ